MTNHTKQVQALLLGERGDLTSPRGSRSWAMAVRWELQELLRNPASQVRHIKSWLLTLERYKGYKQLEDASGRPFTSLQAFCTAPPPHGLGCDTMLLARIMSAAPGTSLTELLASQESHPQAAVHPQRDTPPRHVQDQQDERITMAQDREPSVRRPLPVSLEDQGALERSGSPAETYGVETPLEHLRYWWEKASKAERVQFLNWIKDQQTADQ